MEYTGAAGTVRYGAVRCWCGAVLPVRCGAVLVWCSAVLVRCGAVRCCRCGAVRSVLPTAYCLLPTAHRLLHCLLPTAYFVPRSSLLMTRY